MFSRTCCTTHKFGLAKLWPGDVVVDLETIVFGRPRQVPLMSGVEWVVSGKYSCGHPGRKSGSRHTLKLTFDLQRSLPAHPSPHQLPLLEFGR